MNTGNLSQEDREYYCIQVNLIIVFPLSMPEFESESLDIERPAHSPLCYTPIIITLDINDKFYLVAEERVELIYL